MTLPAPRERDTRIDVFRALALLTIYVDHVPGTAFELWTYKNFGFSDAAEAFVLISGMAVALAYGGRFQPGERLLSTLKMWRRAGVLYVSHIVVTVVTIAIFCAAAVATSRPELLAQINIGPLINDTPKAVVGMATLGHQVGYNNILSVYAVLLLLAPAILAIANRRPKLALVLSGAVWLVAGVFQIAPPNYPEPGVWFLNPLSWQFLFTIGLVSMLHVRRGGALPTNGWLIAAAAIYVIAAFIWIRSPLWGRDVWFGLPAVLTGFDKTYLSLSRLLHILFVAYLVVALPRVSNLFRTAPGHPLAILGRRSLPVFIAGTVLAMVAQVLKFVNPSGLAYDLVLIAAGVTAQFALAYYLEWLSGLGGERATRRRRDAAAPAGPQFAVAAG